MSVMGMFQQPSSKCLDYHLRGSGLAHTAETLRRTISAIVFVVLAEAFLSVIADSDALLIAPRKCCIEAALIRWRRCVLAPRSEVRRTTSCKNRLGRCRTSALASLDLERPPRFACRLDTPPVVSRVANHRWLTRSRNPRAL